ncbi:MAG: bifunctional homocysteine S-methyltransferase/methylenetetrahydrofolate reductase [Anaerolineae bacterium]|nr:bifunctional homocysteine S-methyltransferase/methylenetetrahydrofolate reductase [Anaerolineae bacterium]
MSNIKFLDFLDQQQVLLADGAMGTVLHARGVDIDKCFDALNIDSPAIVADAHREYIEAGAQVILTNTFGANRYKLAKYGLEDQTVAINRAGVEVALGALAASQKKIFLAGDVGPLGVHIEPYGRVRLSEARDAFVEQISALYEAGSDLIVIETMSDLYEIREAVRAVRDTCDLPVVASITFTRDNLTLLGDTPAKAASTLYEEGTDVIGVNCSGGPVQLLQILRAMRHAVPGARFWIKPNAGWPEQVGGRIMYPANAEYFGDYALAFRQAGANIVGGCCGTTPEHIAAMRVALDKQGEGHVPSFTEFDAPVDVDIYESDVEKPSPFAQRLAAHHFTVAVEMSPPRGLATHKLIAGASLLADSGADVINVADSPMARMRMSAWAVCDVVKRQVDVDITLHFPIRGRNLLRVQGDLLAAHALGIRNVFVVMGDPTSIGDYPEAMDNYDLVPSGLIKLIKQGFNKGVEHSGTSIGQPTHFFVGGALNLCPADPDREIKNLQRKIKAGADFFLTQPIYRPDDGPNFLEKYQAVHGPLNKPILAGLLPLVSSKHANFLHNEVPGISIPEEALERITAAGEESARVGVDLAVELTQQIKGWAGGVYIMPQFNRYDMVAEIIEAVK